ncbi:ParB N-terminal domain-containing protein [Nocardioides rotundus]|uniref:ParB N-terminal domain-containing protein n=1 Tax=Nocardioides rotundus TaxID=1774216 RepID=UPI001CC063BA|nr:ParB N-terminal domain-containing protein [Nocardioides rotundus]UAL29797.1 ParB N-terminal domain-containing protein [Nocardioides rotundus]
MGAQTGHIELDRTVESIIVGHRHRRDLGDLDALCESIARDGLLQPLTVTVDGVLVCGARRLAAIKRLGWRTVNVWVRSGISGRLGHLLAEQDDNLLHKDLTPVEAATLYRELKSLMVEDAARRQAATRFSADNQPGSDGAANFAAPSSARGDTREQAAAMIPGGASHTTLDKIDYLQQVAADPAVPEPVRGQAAEELHRIDAGAPVHPGFERVRLAVAGEGAEDLGALAQEALARARARQTKTPQPAGSLASAGGGDEAAPARWPVRAFVATWTELADWWTHYDAVVLATELSDEQITSFLDTADGTSAFADELRTAWQEPTEPAAGARRHLRAL